MTEMATRKGLEPSTSAVTGRHSNRLNYRAISLLPKRHHTVAVWWVVQGSNL